VDMGPESARDGMRLRPGTGVFFGAHGLSVGYPLWLSKFTSASSDNEHNSYGITCSAVGKLLNGCTDAHAPGPGVLHLTNTTAQAEALALQLSEEGDPRVRDALALGIITAPLYAASAEVVADTMSYGVELPLKLSTKRQF